MAERDDLHKAALEQRSADFADLQRELSGTTAGKSQRFLSKSAIDERDPEKQKQRKEQQSSLQRMLLASASYRAAYERLGAALAQAERVVTQALTDIQLRIDTARNGLNDLQDRAARLPDGTRIYRDDAGRIWSEDGRNFDHMDEVIVWPDNAPSHEDFVERRAQLEAEHEERARLERIQIDIGGIRDRYDDPDNPMTRDEIDSAIEDIAAQTSTHLITPTTAQNLAPHQQAAPQGLPTITAL